MDEFLKALRKALGMPDTATQDEITAKASQLCTQATTAAALTTRFTAICSAAGITFDAAKFGDTEQTAICAKLKTPAAADAGELATLRSQFNTLNVDLVKLRGENAYAVAETKVTALLSSGKLAPSQKDWALGTPEKPGYAATNPTEFDALMNVTPAILASGRRAPQGAADEALDEDELALCAQLGIKPEDFKAEKKSRKEAE